MESDDEKSSIRESFYYYDRLTKYMKDPLSDKTQRFLKRNINKQFSDGGTLLFDRIFNSDFEACEFLIKHGADVNLTIEDSRPYTSGPLYQEINPLTLALYQKETKIIQLLLDEGVIIDLDDSYICDAIIKECTCKIDEQVYSDLFKKVIPFATRLTISDRCNYAKNYLNIYVFNDESAKKIYELIPNNCILQRIDVSEQRLFSETIIWIVNIVKKIPSINYLGLGECSICDEHIRVLCNELGHDHNIDTIDLFGNNISDYSIDILIEWIPKNRNIINFEIGGNFFLKDGSRLYDFIRKLKSESKMILLKDRELNEESVFNRDILPLDVFKSIFEFAKFYKPKVFVKKQKIENLEEEDIWIHGL